MTPELDLSLVIFVVGVLLLCGFALYYFSRYLIRKEKNLRRIISEETRHLIESVKLSKEENEMCEMLSSVALYTQNGVIIANVYGQVLWVNRAYIEMFDYDSAGLKTNGGEDTLISASCCPNIELYVKQAVQTKQSIRYETCTLDKNDEKLWVSSLLTPVFNDHDELKRFIIIDTDVTELKQPIKEYGMDLKELLHV